MCRPTKKRPHQGRRTQGGLDRPGADECKEATDDGDDALYEYIREVLLD